MSTVENVKNPPITKQGSWAYYPSSSNKINRNESEHSKFIVKAFMQGMQKGRELEKAAIKKKIEGIFIKNKTKAETLGEDFFLLFKKVGMKCNTVFLGIEGISDFKLLFLVDPESYLSGNFTSIYEASRKKRKEVNSDDFNISIMFMPEVKTTNKHKIISDGYSFYFDGKSK
jgi:hypothetical protein